MTKEVVAEGSEAEAGLHLFSASTLDKRILEKFPAGKIARPLRCDDYDKGFLALLGQLTSVGEMSRDVFESRFHEMKNTRPSSYFVVVVEDEQTGQVVGSASLVVELKFIHCAGSRGRIEDVVVDSSARSGGVGSLLVSLLVSLGRELGVYKMSLECKDNLIGFYGKNGFRVDSGNNFLVQRFDQ